MNAQDDDEDHTLLGPKPIPNSPPPSFHSRASSPTRRNTVDPDLADAFDDDDASEDETDDRQRLVRQNSTPTISSSSDVSRPTPPVAQPNVYAAADSSGSRPRVMGGGFGSDGVFANMSARPERTDSSSEKDELPPVSSIRNVIKIVNSFDQSTNMRLLDLRTSRGRCCSAVLGNHNSSPRSRWS